MRLRISIFYFPFINHSPPACKQHLPGGVSWSLSSTRAINFLRLGNNVSTQAHYPWPRQHTEKAFLPPGNSMSTVRAILFHSSSSPCEPDSEHHVAREEMHLQRCMYFHKRKSGQPFKFCQCFSSTSHSALAPEYLLSDLRPQSRHTFKY